MPLKLGMRNLFGRQAHGIPSRMSHMERRPLCDDCLDASATVHLTIVADGVVTGGHLCAACARTRGIVEPAASAVGEAAIPEWQLAALRSEVRRLAEEIPGRRVAEGPGTLGSP